MRSGIPLAFGCLLTLTPALGFAYFAPLRPNFPVTLPGGGVTAYSLPLVVDIDNDGKKEIVVGTSGTATAGGKLFVLNSNGQIRWSVTLPANINSSPAAGNLLGLPDGSLQIVIGCGSPVLTDHRPGGVYVYRADGTFVWRFLTRTTIGILANGVWSTPALGDLDGDGKDDVVFGSFDEYIYALKGTTGQHLPGWPAWVRDGSWSSASLADLDGDGALEVAIGAYTHAEPPPINNVNGAVLWVFRRDGTLLPGFPQFAPQVPGAEPVGNYSSPAVGDIDGDGCPEIVIGTEATNSAGGRALLAYKNDGRFAAGFPYQLSGLPNSSPALADLDGDGVLDVIAADDGNIYTRNTIENPPNPYLYGLKCNGPSDSPVTELFKMRTKSCCSANNTWEIKEPIVARANGVDDVIFVGGAGYDVTLVSKTGVQLSGDTFQSALPVYTTGHPVVGAAVADLDGTGTLSLIAASGVRNGNEVDSALYVWPIGTTGSKALPWPMFRQNTKREGVRQTCATPASCKRVPPPTSLYTVFPCRVADTRLVGYYCYGGPAMTGGEYRMITITDNAYHSCGVASDAKAVALNVTVTPPIWYEYLPAADGRITMFPTGEALPNTSTVSFRAGQERATEAVVPLGYDGRGNVTLYLAQPIGTYTHVIIDVNGYFK